MNFDFVLTYADIFLKFSHFQGAGGKQADPDGLGPGRLVPERNLLPRGVRIHRQSRQGKAGFFLGKAFPSVRIRRNLYIIQVRAYGLVS